MQARLHHGRSKLRSQAWGCVWAWVGLWACVLTAHAALPEPTSAPEPAANELQLAWLGHDGIVHTSTLSAQGKPLMPHAAGQHTFVQAEQAVPLGSLWKLVAYAQLAESAPHEPDYTCQGRSKEEVYCCEVGQHIDRGTALWRSCGLYFEPARLQWSSKRVGSQLGPTLQALPASLQSLREARHLHARQSVPLNDWLNWLANWAPATQQAARDDLLTYWTQGPGRSKLSQVGSRLRVKTFTLERVGQAKAAKLKPGTSQERWAGASGWLSDGRPVWMAARGSSKIVLPQWGPMALRHIDQVDPGRALAPSLNTPCVNVHYLARYPIERLLNAQGQPVVPQDQAITLPRGAYRLQFSKGNTLDIRSDQDLRWQRAATGQLSARLSLNEYVARVIDREGTAQPQAAARALAVAARSHVLTQGQANGGCLQIDDSSAQQRVAPRPASAGARQASDDTADLVLQGAVGDHSVGQYHTHQARPGVMAWTHALEQSQQGLGFAEILQAAYPGVALQSLNGPQGHACEPLQQAQTWLDRQLPRWRQRLQGQAGFRGVGQPQVCRLRMGLPHTQQASQRVFVRGAQSLDERLTLAHEYLHLSFAGHPRSTQEAFIEDQARALLGLD